LPKMFSDHCTGLCGRASEGEYTRQSSKNAGGPVVVIDIPVAACPMQDLINLGVRTGEAEPRSSANRAPPMGKMSQPMH
jgi:hypothetical protein